MFIKLNIKHSPIKNNAPIVQEMARLKNSVKKFAKILQQNDVIASVGIENNAKIQKYFLILKFGHTFFFIILILRIAEQVKQIPMEYIKASIPIYKGKIHIPINIKIPPKI